MDGYLECLKSYQLKCNGNITFCDLGKYAIVTDEHLDEKHMSAKQEVMYLLARRMWTVVLLWKDGLINSLTG